MKVKEFIELFKEEVKQLYNHSIIVGRKKFEKLNNHEHTYLINIAIYNVVKKYNEESHHQKIFIAPEVGAEENKKSRYDFCLKDKNGDKKLVIEHEHSRRKVNIKNYEKLKNCKSKDKLLICYKSKDNYDEKFEIIINKIKDDKLISLLIGMKQGTQDFTNSKEYEFYLNKNENNICKN